MTTTPQRVEDKTSSNEINRTSNKLDSTNNSMHKTYTKFGKKINPKKKSSNDSADKSGAVVNNFKLKNKPN